MDFFKSLCNVFLGSQDLSVWIASLLWSFLGIVGVKLYYLNPKNAFSLKFWINDNLLDVIKGVFWTFILLRLGNYVFKIASNFFSFSIPETNDFVIVVIFLSAVIQVKLHKKRKPFNKHLKKEMHVFNTRNTNK